MNITALAASLFDTFAENVEVMTIAGASYNVLPIQHMSGAYDIIEGGRPDNYTDAVWMQAADFQGDPEVIKTVIYRGKVRLVVNVDMRNPEGIVWYMRGPTPAR